MIRIIQHIINYKKIYLIGLVIVAMAGYLYANPQIAQKLRGYLLQDEALYERLTEPETTLQTTLDRNDLGLRTEVPEPPKTPVQLEAPNGKQLFREGDVMTIKWTMPYESKAILYLLSLGKEKGFVQKEVIAGNLTFPDIPYRWTVPRRNGQYWIQVEADGKADESDQFFTIKPKRDEVIEGEDPNPRPTTETQTPQIVEVKNNGSARFHNLEQELPENLDALLDQVEPVGQMMANVVQTSVSDTWKAGDEIFIAGYQLQAAGEDVTVDGLTIINDLQGGFNQPVATEAIRNIFLLDERDQLIAVRGLQEGLAVFNGLDIPIHQDSKFLLKIYATITTDPEAASQIANSQFRLGIRSIRAIGKESDQLVTISDAQGIHNNDRINPQTVMGAALRILWPETQMGSLTYGENTLMNFSLESTGMEEASIQNMVFSTTFDSVYENPEVINYHLSCTNTEFESLEMNSDDGIFEINRSLPPGEIVDCVLTGEMAKLGADNVTAHVSLNGMNGNFMGPEGIESAPEFTYDHSCKSIVFADAYLDTKVREALDIDHQDPLTRDEVEGLKILDASGRFENRVMDLAGIECLRNLEELNVNNKESDQAGAINNIRYLDRLTGLKKLNLARNQIDDISTLENLTALTELRLADNQVKDIGVLSGLTGLRTLDLSKNQIADLMALNNLTALQVLTLSNNQIKDLGPLTNLKELVYLYLQDNQVQKLSPLAALTKLLILDVGHNQITDILPLSNMSLLEKLVVYDNQVQDWTPLMNFPKLKEVSLFNNNPFKGPRNCETIKTLKARGTTVKEDLTWCQ